MSAATPYVDLDLDAGTLRFSVVHGRPTFAFRRAGQRAWATTPVTPELAETFLGHAGDLMVNARLAARQQSGAA